MTPQPAALPKLMTLECIRRKAIAFLNVNENANEKKLASYLPLKAVLNRVPRLRALSGIPFIGARRLSENALFPHIFVKLEKIILGILTICLR